MTEQSRQILTVDEISSRISLLFLGDPILKSAVVRGEIAEMKKHTSGHVYFTLLGRESRISCAFFKNYLSFVPQWPKNGDEVIAEGGVSVYAPRGSYQLLVRRLVPLGKGAADRARQELQARLEKEGLFDPRRKRPLPLYPQKVAVVTSRTGAALQDVLSVSAGRMPSCHILVIPTLVQGYDAPREIAEALGRAAKIPDLDCVMLVRGGGSRDDLAPFDDEQVVRAVAGSPVPLVTGVGHEIDSTLSDLAADLFAPTPSGAAERVFPDFRDILSRLKSRKSLAASCVIREIRTLEKDVQSLRSRGARTTERIMAELDSSCRLSAARLCAAADGRLAAFSERLSSGAASLDALSPLKVFGRGFILCEKDGTPVRSAGQIFPGDEVRLRFQDGDVTAGVRAVHRKEGV